MIIYKELASITKKTVKFNICRAVFRMEAGQASIQVEFRSSVLGVLCHLGRLLIFVKLMLSMVWEKPAYIREHAVMYRHVGSHVISGTKLTQTTLEQSTAGAQPALTQML